MTIEKLLECRIDELEAMSDAQLLEHFKPYLPYTRPELARKIEHRNTTDSHRYESKKGFSKKVEANKIMEQFGLNFRFK